MIKKPAKISWKDKQTAIELGSTWDPENQYWWLSGEAIHKIDHKEVSTKQEQDILDRLDLHVPYGEKDEAKNLGALWDPNTKSWYIDRMRHHDWSNRFSKWLFPPL